MRVFLNVIAPANYLCLFIYLIQIYVHSEFDACNKCKNNWDRSMFTVTGGRRDDANSLPFLLDMTSAAQHSEVSIVIFCAS